jgi:REP element-mobilizing transposase RayT
MPAVRVTKELKDQIYFVTFTIKNWYYLSDRHHRFKILEDSFVYCQKHKNLKIYSFVFMLNHLHFIGSADDLGAVIRDMKTHLSKAFKKNLIETEPSVLKLFETNEGYQFWMNTNYPKLVESDDFFEQKFDYIHQNPVKKEYVHYPEDWRWSSASKIPSRIQVTEFPS